jgi:hypothetical protein
MPKVYKSFKEIVEVPENVDHLYKVWTTSTNKQYDIIGLNTTFGVDWSKETWARYLGALVPIFETGVKSNGTPLDEALVDMKIKKQQMAIETNSLNKKYRHFARQDMVMKRFVDTCLEYSTKDFTFCEDREQMSGTYDFDLPHVFLSDFHFRDETTKVAEVMQDVKESMWEMYPGKKYVIVLTGDSIQGVLRHGDLFEENWNPVEQTVKFSKVFADNVDIYNVAKIVVIPGNHGEIRVSDYKGLKNPNHEMYIAAQLKVEFGEDKVEYTDYYYGGNVEVIHGHQFMGKAKIQSYAKQDPTRFLIHAHLHNFSIIDNVISLPALSEPNDYELGLGFEPNVPRYVIVDEHLRLTIRDMQRINHGI